MTVQPSSRVERAGAGRSVGTQTVTVSNRHRRKTTGQHDTPSDVGANPGTAQDGGAPGKRRTNAQARRRAATRRPAARVPRCARPDQRHDHARRRAERDGAEQLRPGADRRRHGHGRVSEPGGTGDTTRTTGTPRRPGTRHRDGGATPEGKEGAREERRAGCTCTTTVERPPEQRSEERPRYDSNAPGRRTTRQRGADGPVPPRGRADTARPPRGEERAERTQRGQRAAARGARPHRRTGGPGQQDSHAPRGRRVQHRTPRRGGGTATSSRPEHGTSARRGRATNVRPGRTRSSPQRGPEASSRDARRRHGGTRRPDRHGPWAGRRRPAGSRGAAANARRADRRPGGGAQDQQEAHGHHAPRAGREPCRDESGRAPPRPQRPAGGAGPQTRHEPVARTRRTRRTRRRPRQKVPEHRRPAPRGTGTRPRSHREERTPSRAVAGRPPAAPGQPRRRDARCRRQPVGPVTTRRPRRGSGGAGTGECRPARRGARAAPGGDRVRGRSRRPDRTVEYRATRRPRAGAPRSGRRRGRSRALSDRRADGHRHLGRAERRTLDHHEHRRRHADHRDVRLGAGEGPRSRRDAHRACRPVPPRPGPRRRGRLSG